MSFLNSKKDVSEEQNERHKRILAVLLKDEGNKNCADCRSRNPTWASVNLGVFVCLTCSGIHRSLGVHISQVRSCNLDTWLPKQVEFCKNMGNVRGNRYWEARLPDHFRRPPSGNPNPELAAFIREKYVERRYAALDCPEPPTIDNYLSHPYGKPETPDQAQQSDAPLASQPASNQPSAVPSTASISAGRPSLPMVQPLPSRSAAPPAPAQVTADLLGGFDELAAASTPPVPSGAALSAAYDPFDALLAAAAPSSSAPAPQQPQQASAQPLSRNSLEDWSDFHSAPPPPPPPVNHSSSTPHSLHLPPSNAHARSMSVSEGVAIRQMQPQLPQAKDPFANTMDDNLVSAMRGVSVSDGRGYQANVPTTSTSTAGALTSNGNSGSLQQASSMKHASTKSADEILRLFDAPSSSGGAPGDGFGDYSAGSFHSSLKQPLNLGSIMGQQTMQQQQQHDQGLGLLGQAAAPLGNSLI